MMKIGIFDSGVGGLIIWRAIVKKLPEFDYIYLGDTKRVPYGNRSQDTIYEFTKEAVEYLFQRGCLLVVLACNTASAQALRRLQRKFLPKHYPGRRILGVVVPTLEAIADKNFRSLGILATQATVNSQVYAKEGRAINSKIKIFQEAAPLLVPLVENGGAKFSRPVLKSYLRPLMQKKVQALVLACTHYPLLKNKIRKLCGKNIKIISQDEIIPAKLSEYLNRHPEIQKRLSKKGEYQMLVTDLTPHIQKLARLWFGKNLKPKLIKY